MKIKFEKEEIQLLGQLALEIAKFKYRPELLLEAMLIFEFRVENAGVFEFPAQCRRKLKMSTLVAMRRFLHHENFRGDAIWDSTLISLRDKLQKALNTAEYVSPLLLQLH